MLFLDGLTLNREPIPVVIPPALPLPHEVDFWTLYSKHHRVITVLPSAFSSKRRCVSVKPHRYCADNVKDYMLPYDSTSSPSADIYYKILESLLSYQYFKKAVRH